ncbi:MAG: sensor histidine kinase, partial [Candidatus Thorarchaeota archaeon]
EKMSALGQLVAGVAHEINNPLAYLKSNSEFLGEFLIDVNDKFRGDDLKIYNEMKQLIDSNIEGTNRIATITKTLKRFAKPDQEEKTESNINQGLKDTLIIVHNHLKHRVEVHEDLGEIPNVKCNIGQINQVFMNLIMNSSQAMESGDIWIKTWNEDNRVNVEIKDNGSGIPEDALNKIFDPFYTTKPEGTGLGLSLVYKIIQNHNGFLNVNSKIGEGTTMRISLPVEE